MVDLPEPSEAEIDAVIAEFGGDPREAIRALLHDLATLARDGTTAISRGYVRGRWPHRYSKTVSASEVNVGPQRADER